MRNAHDRRAGMIYALWDAQGNKRGLDSGNRVWVLRRVQGLGFGVWDLESRIWGSRFIGFRV